MSKQLEDSNGLPFVITRPKGAPGLENNNWPSKIKFIPEKDGR